MEKRGYMWLLLCLTVLAAIAGLYAGERGYQYSREYIPGTGNIKGNVDTAAFLQRDEAFAIGANLYGYAVFKDPEAALAALEAEYDEGLDLLRREFELEPLSQQNFREYKTCGWQVTAGTEAEREQAYFVTSFMDIYENSFPG